MFPLSTESTSDNRGTSQTESLSLQSPGFAHGSDFNTSALRILRIQRTSATSSAQKTSKPRILLERLSIEVWIGGCSYGVSQRTIDISTPALDRSIERRCADIDRPLAYTVTTSSDPDFDTQSLQQYAGLRCFLCR